MVSNSKIAVFGHIASGLCNVVSQTYCGGCREIITKEAWRSGRMRFSKHPSDVRVADTVDVLMHFITCRASDI